MKHEPAFRSVLSFEIEQIKKNNIEGLQAIEALIEDPFLSPYQAMSVLAQLTQHADKALGALWQYWGLGQQACLIAVGGYARQQLFFHSDIDVMVMLAQDHDDKLRERVEQFIRSAWDIGLEMSSSVRTLKECREEAQKEVTIQTALMESRYLIGDETLYRDLSSAIHEQMNVQAFFSAKVAEMHQRHHRYDDTPYALEPNCKESPGGLRDLHLILWIAQAAGLGKTWKALEASGLITSLERKQLKAHEAFISLIRLKLHKIAKKKQDRLLFDWQIPLAKALGDKKEPVANNLLMRRYYWSAKAITQLNQLILLLIEDHIRLSFGVSLPVVPINERFGNKEGALEVLDEAVYIQNPHAILETFLLLQSEKSLLGLSAKTQRALYAARGVMDGAFRKEAYHHAQFMRLLSGQEKVSKVLHLMNQTSVLGRYLWAFRRTVGWVQNDLFHAYTVDQHILKVMRNIRKFFISDYADEHPFCSQLAASWDKPWILLVAALFHDIGKGRGGDHSVIGAIEAKRFCQAHQISQEDTELIVFLVLEHLSLSQVAQKSDLSDVELIQAFADKVKSPRYLTALYLLTVADIKGTSAQAWTHWKEALIQGLYKSTLQILGGEKSNFESEIHRRQEACQSLLAFYFQEPKNHALWSRVEVSYFMRHEADEMAWHLRMIEPHALREPTTSAVVRARFLSQRASIQVMVYMPDQEDLFARLCAYFAQAQLSIYAATIYTTIDHFALDTFEIQAPDKGVGHREVMALIENQLPFFLNSSELPFLPPKKRLSRRVRSFPCRPTVELFPSQRDEALLSIAASDRPGLLYQVAQVLAGHQVVVQWARISTLGERVEDVFSIKGPVFLTELGRIKLEQALRSALESLEVF